MALSFTNKKSRNIGNALTAIESYTVPAATSAIITCLNISNVLGADTTVDVTVYDGANDFYLVKGATLLAGGAPLVLGAGERLVLKTGESIRVKGGAASSVDAVMSVVEKS